MPNKSQDQPNDSGFTDQKLHHSYWPELVRFGTTDDAARLQSGLGMALTSVKRVSDTIRRLFQQGIRELSVCMMNGWLLRR